MFRQIGFAKPSATILAGVVAGTMVMRAGEPDRSIQIQQLREQLQKLQQTFEETVRRQQQEIDALQKQIDELRRNVPVEQAAPEPLAKPFGSAATPPEQAEPEKAESPDKLTRPITLIGGQKNYLNISFDAIFAAGTSTKRDVSAVQAGGHDPIQRGFTAQNLETVFEGNVDPYLRGEASFVGHIDREGDFQFEAEEAYFETLSLPANLQFKAGLFLTEFGRINPTHPHVWDFVDVPIVAARFLGPEGLRSPGARVSWLLPTPFYSELFVAMQNSGSATAYSFRGSNHAHGEHDGSTIFGRQRIHREVKGIDDLLFAPRYAVSFDLTENQTVLLGTSAAFGPNNTGCDTDTQIFGLDLFWKWKSPTHHAGFPFVAWQTEVMARRFEAGSFVADENDDGFPEVNLPHEVLWDYGLYSQLTWGFKRGWVLGLRGDWVTGEAGAFDPDPERETRWRISPSLTLYPTEFSKLRLQYNYDRGDILGVAHSVWLQFEFMLGSHAAHKF